MPAGFFILTGTIWTGAIDGGVKRIALSGGVMREDARISQGREDALIS